MSRPNAHRLSPEARKALRRRRLLLARRAMLVLLLAGGGTAGAMWLNDALSVRDWNIRGPAELTAAIDKSLSQMPDRSFLATRPAMLKQRWLAQLPDLAGARIARILPHHLDIELLPRHPIALWQDALGHIHLVDAEGNAYRELKRNEAPDLPMLHMHAAQLAASARLLARLGRMHKGRELSELHARGDAWQLYFSRGERWSIPRAAEDETLKRLSALLAQPRWHAGKWRIDARNTSRWFIRPAMHEGVI